MGTDKPDERAAKIKDGRPKIIIEETKLRGLLRLKPTLADTAAFFGCSEKTIERACWEYGKCTFVDFRAQNMVHTRLGLVREAIAQATKGNTAMLIFCLKNVCDWREKAEEKVEHSGSLTLSTHAQLVEEIEQNNRKGET